MGAMEKALNFIGINTNPVDEMEVQDDFGKTSPIFSPNESEGRGGKKWGSGKVVNMHETTQIKVAVEHPADFEEAREIADHLKTGRAVTVNLEHLESGIAKRIIDFLSGTVYAINGNMQRIGTKIFLVTPSTVGIKTDEKDEFVKRSWK